MIDDSFLTGRTSPRATPQSDPFYYVTVHDLLSWVKDNLATPSEPGDLSHLVSGRPVRG